MGIYKELVEHLEALGRGEKDPIDKTQGICSEVLVFLKDTRYKYLHDLSNEIYEIMKLHPEYSGRVAYPIKAPKDFHLEDTNCTLSKGCYYYTISRDRKWDRRYSYGKARRNLCLFIAEELRKRYSL